MALIHLLLPQLTRSHTDDFCCHENQLREDSTRFCTDCGTPAAWTFGVHDYIPEPDLAQLRIAFNKARHESDLTFDKLAERSGLARQTLINLSQGRHKGDLNTWLRLSAAFDTGLDDLLAPVWGDGPRPGHRDSASSV